MSQAKTVLMERNSFFVSFHEEGKKDRFSSLHHRVL